MTTIRTIPRRGSSVMTRLIWHGPFVATMDYTITTDTGVPTKQKVMWLYFVTDCLRDKEFPGASPWYPEVLGCWVWSDEPGYWAEASACDSILFDERADWLLKKAGFPI